MCNIFGNFRKKKRYKEEYKLSSERLFEIIKKLQSYINKWVTESGCRMKMFRCLVTEVYWPIATNFVCHVCFEEPCQFSLTSKFSPGSPVSYSEVSILAGVILHNNLDCSTGFAQLKINTFSISGAPSLLTPVTSSIWNLICIQTD